MWGIVVKPYEDMNKYCKTKQSVRRKIIAIFDAVRGDLESVAETGSKFDAQHCPLHPGSWLHDWEGSRLHTVGLSED